MEVVVNNNIFEFHVGLWKQRIGTAMGSRPVPKYVNVLMAKTDDKIKDIAKEYENDNSEGLKVLKLFLDDFFSQLTMSHTSPTKEAIEDQCDCEKKSEIPFLDTLVSFKNGFLDTDLYQKETDRNQYLLPSSCHVKQTTAAIPYSQSSHCKNM